MLNFSPSWSRQKIWLGLGIAGVAAIANALFGLEHDWHLLSILTMASGGAMLFANARRSWATVTKQSPEINREALERELQRVQQLSLKIGDANLRAQVQSKAAVIAKNLQKNHFQIVIFGTGAVGKTAVINALLDRAAGKTDAVIGTTIARQEYDHLYQKLNQKLDHKFKRQISLIDTSGIQEVGQMGRQREGLAIQDAQNADLLIFVTSGDLTSTEYQELGRLARLGKRLILAFNKTDLYLPSDRQLILEQLQNHTQSFLSAIDIVAIAAKPNPIKVRQYANPDISNLGNTELALKEWWEELPADVSSLKERIESILSNEWEDLLIQNMHLQIEGLMQEIETIINQQRRQDAKVIIKRYQAIAATTVFANPIPAIDLLAGAAINTQMLMDLAKVYERSLNWSQARQYALIIAQNLLQLGCVEVATSAIAAFFKVNALTYAIGGSMQAFTAAYLTHIGGMSFVEYLEIQPHVIHNQALQAQTWQNICQKTFNGFKSDRFFMDLVSNLVVSKA